jgi:hypothetical protein
VAGLVVAVDGRPVHDARGYGGATMARSAS